MSMGGGNSLDLKPIPTYMVLCNVYGLVETIECKKRGEWDGWLGLGMTSTQSLESVRPKIPKTAPFVQHVAYVVHP